MNFLPVYPMREIVVGRVTDDRAEANRQRKETLCDSGIPDVRLPQGVPFRCDKEKDAVDSTF